MQNTAIAASFSVCCVVDRAVNLRPFNLNKRVGSLGRARRHRLPIPWFV